MDMRNMLEIKKIFKARSTNVASYILINWHQPKMPASLIKKD